MDARIMKFFAAFAILALIFAIGPVIAAFILGAVMKFIDAIEGPQGP